jgi:hypothetical protein
MQILGHLILENKLFAGIFIVLSESLDILRVYFCESEVDDEPLPRLRIIEEVAGFDVSVIDSYFFETSDSNEQLNQIVLNILNAQSSEEILGYIRVTMK